VGLLVLAQGDFPDPYSGSINFIKPFDIPFTFTLPSLLHINVITGALQMYDTGPKAPANNFFSEQYFAFYLHSFIFGQG
jgi:hypothetical protein